MKPDPGIEIDILVECAGGGVGRHVLDLCQGLTARGWPVRLVVSLRRAEAIFLDGLKDIAGIEVTTLDLRRSPHHSDLPAITQLWRHFRSSGRRHILHAHSTKAGLIAAAVRPWALGSVFSPHAYRGMDAMLRGPARLGIRAAEKLISLPHDRVIAVSPAEFAYAQGLGVAAERLRFIANGIDMGRIQAQAAAGRARRGQGQVTLGFVGRLVHQKNPLAFVRAVALVAAAGIDVRAVVIGDGELRPAMEEEVARAGIGKRVRFLGAVDAVSNLGEIDLMIHCSHYESMPYSILEALAAGIPQVAVRNAGTEAILGPQAHLIADPDDAQGLADEAVRLILDPEAFGAARRGAEEIARRFTIDAMVDAIAGEYQEVLTTSGHGVPAFQFSGTASPRASQ